MKKSERIIDHLDLDEVWNNPTKPWVFWANRVGAHPNSVADALRREGWEKENGKIVKAPCVYCYRVTHRDRMNEDRVCVACNHPNRNLYEKELKEFLTRHPHMVSRVHREL